MKMLVWILGAVLALSGIDDIATINRLKKQAEEAYQQGDYAQAATYYQLLVDSLQVQDETVHLNLAHAQLQAGDTATAQRQYGQLMNAEDTRIKSLAYQQLGNITTQQQQYQDALAMYKESIMANPTNEDARYNYELVKKLQKEQEQQEQSQSENNEDQSEEEKNQQEQEQQQNQDQSDQQQKDQQGESSEEQNENEQQSDSEQQEGDQQPSDPQEQDAQQGEEQSEGEQSEEEMSSSPLSERLEEMNISEEKARMILEAMRNNEMQYIQQNRRKPSKPKDRSKPDW